MYGLISWEHTTLTNTAAEMVMRLAELTSSQLLKGGGNSWTFSYCPRSALIQIELTNLRGRQWTEHSGVPGSTSWTARSY